MDPKEATPKAEKPIPAALPKKTYQYEVEKIEAALNLLNTIPVAGVKNCETILKLHNILCSPIKIEGGK